MTIENITQSKLTFSIELLIGLLFSVLQLYDQEAKKKYKEVATNFEAPKGLFSNKDDHMAEFWTLD